MPRHPTKRPSRPKILGREVTSARLALVGLALAALSSRASRARASDVAIVPSADGRIGAWLVAGPVPIASAKKLDLATVVASEGAKLTKDGWAPRWQAVGSGTSALDLAKTLSVGSDPGPYAVVGGVLSLKEDFDGWLLVSADGAIEIRIGPERPLTRDSPRLRAGSWDVVPVKLAAGAHRLTFLLGHRGRHWAFEARVLDRANLLPPRGASLLLPGTDHRDAQRLAAALGEVRLETGLDASGYRPRLHVAHPRGVPAGLDLSVSARVRLPGKAAPLLDVRAGVPATTDRGVHALDVQLPLIAPDALGSSAKPAVAQVEVTVGARTLELPLTLAPGAPQTLLRARELVATIARGESKGLSDPAVVTATLDHGMQRLGAAGRGPLADPDGVTDALESLEGFVDDVVDGADPVMAPGVRSLALRSRVDGSLQPVTVHVPARVSKERKYPLVLLLHGYGGTPDSVMKAFLDTGSRAPVLGGFVVAPNAHGNAFYRGPGERNAMETLSWALDAYPIDRRRVSITGVSMGGTGAAHLALRYAERFSAASPLCGYHSFFVRRDTSARPIRPWEVSEMHHFSPASWAENGRNLPLYVAHGTRDLPLENSKVLVERYRELGQHVVDDWPDVGHAVWEETWAGARMWGWLEKFRREAAPLRVSIRTDSLRYADRDWVHIVELERPHLATVDARLGGNDRLMVTTAHVVALALDRPVPRVSERAAISLEIDGTELGFGPSEKMEVVRDGSKWRKGAYARPAGHKRAHVEGPLRDAYLSDLVFAYGTLDPAATRANREVAEAFARYRPEADVRYRVMADRDVDQRVEREASVFLVGNEESNAVLADLGQALPIRAHGGKLRFGDRAIDPPGAGALFVYPNPRSPERYVVVLTAPTVAGIWRSLSLPQLLPDFVLYDDAVADAAGEVVLSRGSVIGAGHFADDWTLPSTMADPHGKPAAGTASPAAAPPSP